MTSNDLVNKWSNISPSSNERGFRLLRITSDCKPELSLGLDVKVQRCLVLSVQSDTAVQIRDIFRDNISLEYLLDDGIAYVVIRLMDAFFVDLFDDLIVSIYHTVSEITEESRQAAALIQAFHKWSEFFDRGNAARLTRAEIQGLLGELRVLQGLTEEITPSGINNLLSAWRGPYEKSADFILDDKDIEVKSMTSGRNEIRISSEYQLEADPGKALELIVIEVESNPQHGISLSGQVKIIRELVHAKLGDFSIVLTALKQKGLTVDNIGDYDNLRFIFVMKTIYDAGKGDFPKLTKSNTADAISGIRYNLRLSLISEHIIDSEDYRARRV